MTVHLSDGNACEQVPKPCGCGGGCDGHNHSHELPVININVDSNNKEGYNTLNPGSITRESYGYPVNSQVVKPDVVNPRIVNPQIVNPNVVNNPTLPSGQISSTSATVAATPKMPAITPIVRKPRVFYPEFL